MAETEPARDVGGPEELDPQQLVDGVDGVALRDIRGGGGQLRLERVAGDSGAFEHTPDRGIELRQLHAQGCRDGGWHRSVLARPIARAGSDRAAAASGARELLDVERHAAAVLVHRLGVGGGDGLSEERPGVGERQGLEGAVDERALALGARQLGGEELLVLPGARREHEHHPRVGRAPQQRAGELE